MAKIFLMPSTGKYEGQLLVFDHVDSMNHISNAKIPSHPVESLNRSSADHRYLEGTQINISGNISDNWTTLAVILPGPEFRTKAFVDQTTLRLQVFEALGDDSEVTKLVNRILDKEPYLQTEILDLPLDVRNWATEADRLLSEEKDQLLLAADKDLLVSSEISNNRNLSGQINTIAQANEMLRELDRSSDLITVYSLYNVYENMVITSLSNPLPSDRTRGAFWISITLTEQLIAKSIKNPLNIDPNNSELVHGNSDQGKQAITLIAPDDYAIKAARAIYKQEVGSAELLKLELLTVDVENDIVIAAAREYMKAGNRDSNSEAAARRSIKGALPQFKF